MKSEVLVYFCQCATTSGNIDLVNAEECVFTADKKVVKTHFFLYYRLVSKESKEIKIFYCHDNITQRKKEESQS